MGYMGEELRRARESKGLSLLEAEEVTKIRVKYLEALENENFNVIPGKVYIKGFVKNYAAYLGLNVEPFIEYLNETAFTGMESEEEPEFVVTGTKANNGFGLKHVFAAIIVMALGYVFITNSNAENNYPSAQKGNTSSSQSEADKNQGQGSDDNSSAPNTSPEEQSDKTGATSSKSADNSAAASSPGTVSNPGTTNKPGITSNTPAVKPNPAPSSLVVASNPNAKVNIVLRAARQTSWALVKVDGKVKFQGNISLNQQLAFNGNRAIYVHLGNAGGVDVYHNGKLLGALGPNGQISKQTFN